MRRLLMDLGITGHTKNTDAVASPKVIGEQRSQPKNTSKDCSFAQLKLQLFFSNAYIAV